MNLIEALQASGIKIPVKRNKDKLNLNRVQLRTLWMKFNKSLLIINDTPKSWVIKTKDFGTLQVSKSYSIKDGLFINYIESWYVKEHMNILKTLTIKVR